VKDDELNCVLKLERETYDNPWNWGVFKRMASLAKDFFLVSIKDNEVIGYSVGEIKSRGNKKTGHILNLTVKKKFRKVGIGSKLLDELENKFLATGAKTAYLEVRESNFVAQKLYSSRNYVFFQKICDYYCGEDGYLMIKNLK
jgi:ribosomal-protein-alanine N-acetyltransferase